MTRHPEHQYLDILRELRDKLLSRGATANRTAVKAVKVVGRTMRFNLSDGTIPLGTTKKLHLKSIVEELIWIISGDTNNETLRQKGVSIWDEWALKEDTRATNHMALLKVGDLGPLYGEVQRHFPAGDFFDTMTDEELERYIHHMEPKQHAYLVEHARKTPGGAITPEAARVVLNEKLGIDQLSQAITLLKLYPNSRRNIVTSWNPQFVPTDDMSPQDNVIRGRAALAACHAFFQFVTEELTDVERLLHHTTHHPDWKGVRDMLQTSGDGSSLVEYNAAWFDRMSDAEKAGIIDELNTLKVPTHRLDCLMYQRSCDFVIGVPYNVASYAILTCMVAQVVNMVPGDLVWTGGDVHLYQNLLPAANTQLEREPHPYPKLVLNPVVTSLFDFTFGDFRLVDYLAHPSIKASVAV